MTTRRMQLSIEGMSCGSCVSHVRSALSKLPGVHVDAVDVGGATVSLVPDVEEASLRLALRDAGYSLTGVRPATDTPEQENGAAPAVTGCCCAGERGHAPPAPTMPRRSALKRHPY